MQSRPDLAKPLLRAIRIVALLTGAALAAGCSSKGDTALLNPDPPGKMFADGDARLARGSYTEAAVKFENLDRDHPYAPEARRAMVMAAYAYYKAGKYPEAIAAAKRYTALHPGTKEAALAHHIIASANFDDIRTPGRDQTETRRALAELKLLRDRYPDSPYTKQAENRIRIAEDLLAASEMNVGRYYLQRSNHLAAINRFKVVVAEYQTTAHVEEALYRIVESSLSLGIVPEAQAAAAVLGHNFSGSVWYRDAHALLKSDGLSPQASTGGWFSNIFKPAAKPAPAVSPQKVPEGLPPADQMPAPRVPGSDIPTASTTPKQKPPFGLGRQS